MIINPDQVTVEQRIRTTPDSEDEIQELMQSLTALGQLQPIVVTGDNGNGYKLQAGERRLIAIKRLTADGRAPRYMEPGQIKAELFGNLSPHVQLMIEFDENVKRKDFSYLEKASFIRKFHETMKAQSDGKWTNEMTAAALRVTPPLISYYLRVEEAVKTDKMVGKATTLRSAIKRMKVVERTQERKDEVQEDKAAADALTRARGYLLLGDAVNLIKTVPDNSIDFVNFDPPWGDNTGRKSNENWEGFEDDTESSDELMEALLPELYRVLKEDRIMAFWYRIWAYNDMIERLESTGFNVKFMRTPCIWYKPDKVSDQNRFPEKSLLETYETFLFARKGDPLIHDRNRQNVFVFDRVPRASLIHPTEKPIELCSALLKIGTVAGETVLDPTAGSSAFLHAALLMDRKPLGFELEEAYYDRGLLRLGDVLKNRKEI